MKKQLRNILLILLLAIFGGIFPALGQDLGSNILQNAGKKNSDVADINKAVQKDVKAVTESQNTQQQVSPGSDASTGNDEGTAAQENRNTESSQENTGNNQNRQSSAAGTGDVLGSSSVEGVISPERGAASTDQQDIIQPDTSQSNTNQGSSGQTSQTTEEEQQPDETAQADDEEDDESRRYLLGNYLGDTVFIIPFNVFIPILSYGDVYDMSFQYGFGIQFREFTFWKIVPEFHFFNLQIESKTLPNRPNSTISMMQFQLGLSIHLDIDLPFGSNNYFSIFGRIREGITRLKFESDVESGNPEIINVFSLSAGAAYPVYNGVSVGVEFGYQNVATAGSALQSLFVGGFVEVRL